MKKISFAISTIANVITLVITIISYVKLSKGEVEGDWGDYILAPLFYADGPSAWAWITIVLMVISLLLLMICYIKEGGTIKRVLMIGTISLQFLDFIVFIVVSLLRLSDAINVVLLIGSGLMLISAILMFADSDIRPAYVYWLISGVWNVIGLVGIVTLILIGVPILMVLSGGGRTIEVYDKMGNFIGHMYQD